MVVKFIAVPNPNQIELDSIFESIDALLQVATDLGVDKLRVDLAMRYFAGRYGPR